MRDLNYINDFRLDMSHVYGNSGDGKNGVFSIPSPIDQKELRVIASDGFGWDHVSVSRGNRCPNWDEMAHVAKLFFKDDEVAMQLRVRVVDHVNYHPNCLHWWRPQREAIPTPPSIMVGVNKETR